MFQYRYVSCAAALSLTWVHVLAGSRAWQPSFQQVGAAESLIEFGYGNGSSAPLASRMEKRYVTINPNEVGGDSVLWPDGIVVYCWKGDAAAQAGRLLREGLALWHDAGLPSDAFDWKEHPDCANAPRAEYLEVVFDRNAGNTCFPGKRNVGQSSGGTLTLNGRDDVGHLSAVVNTAHEMGHAWGLLHEHQNPRLWPVEYGGNGLNPVFGTTANPFKCQNLADYETAKAVYGKANPQFSGDALDQKFRELVCRTWALANKFGFSASQYLPDLGSGFKARTDPKAIDYESIMIYPTGAGGGPNRQAILGKADGSSIPIVKQPSAYDIDGLKKLYGVKKSKKFTPLGDRSNPKKGLLDSILRKTGDIACP